MELRPAFVEMEVGPLFRRGVWRALLVSLAITLSSNAILCAFMRSTRR